MSEQNNTIKSYNPATGEILGEVSITGREEVENTVKKAQKSFSQWSKLSFKERAEFMIKIKKVMLKRKEEILDILVKEIGKPKMEALQEFYLCLEKLNYYAKNSEKVLRDEKVNLGIAFRGVKSKIVFEPIGVIGIIIPWNFPLVLCFSSMVPALMAGNTVILKPSEYTPFCILKIKEIIKEARLTDGVVGVLTGDGSTGQRLVESDVDRIVFTGSVATGKKVMQSAAHKLHSIVLELGGKDPAIVCSDTDLDLASNNIIWAAFLNAGQVCSSAERIYVMEDIVEEFIKKVVEKTEKLKVGNGLEPSTDIGPLINRFQLDVVLKHIKDAKNKGARILTGGKQLKELGELFYAPTVLTDVNHNMLIMREETFGPVLPIMKVKNEVEAIKLANDSDFGLAATIWTKDFARGQKIAKQINAGNVWINTFGVETPTTPWGGVKNSGIGRISSRYGMLNFVNIKCVTLDYSHKTKQDWWYPYSKQKLDYFNEIISNFHSDKITDKIKAVIKLLKGCSK